MALSTSAERALRTRWWVPVLVLAGTGIGVLAPGAVPALLQGHTFRGSLDGVTGYLVWTGGRAQVLAGIAWVAPFWLAGTALLLRSALWGPWTGSVLTESRWQALPGIAATLAGIGLLITLKVSRRRRTLDLVLRPPLRSPHGHLHAPHPPTSPRRSSDSSLNLRVGNTDGSQYGIPPGVRPDLKATDVREIDRGL